MSSIRSIADDGVYYETIKPAIPSFISRTHLPARGSTKSISIWSLLRSSIGKDLMRITVPVAFNEPLSFHQRLAEYMEYVSLIKKAAVTTDPVKRMELITAFSLSTLAASCARITKPFSPLLYETYELSRPDLGFKFVAEQVSHHPPISAFHAQGDEFEFYANVEPRLKFWGRSLEITPMGTFTLVLTSLKETYTWHPISACVYNIYGMGRMYLCLHGQINITCEKNDLKTEIRFNANNNSGPDAILHGEIYQGNEPIRSVYGNFTEYIASTSYGTFQRFKSQWKKEYRHAEKSGNTNLITLFPESRLLWRVHKKPPNNKDYYNMSYFALILNEMVQEKIPRTDVRFRRDIRLMEDGNIDSAGNEKDRLEKNQRARAAKQNSKPDQPLWFTFGKDDGSHMFNGKYWDRVFTESPDIF